MPTAQGTPSWTRCRRFIQMKNTIILCVLILPVTEVMGRTQRKGRAKKTNKKNRKASIEYNPRKTPVTPHKHPQNQPENPRKTLVKPRPHKTPTR